MQKILTPIIFSISYELFRLKGFFKSTLIFEVKFMSYFEIKIIFEMRHGTRFL